MMAALFLIVDADKKYWVGATENEVVEAFNDNDGILPMKLIKILVDCPVPKAQEVLVTIAENGDMITADVKDIT